MLAIFLLLVMAESAAGLARRSGLSRGLPTTSAEGLAAAGGFRRGGFGGGGGGFGGFGGGSFGGGGAGRSW